MNNNPFIGIAHHDSSKERIKTVHKHRLQGEIDVVQAMEEGVDGK